MLSTNWCACVCVCVCVCVRVRIPHKYEMQSCETNMDKDSRTQFQDAHKRRNISTLNHAELHGSLSGSELQPV